MHYLNQKVGEIFMDIDINVVKSEILKELIDLKDPKKEIVGFAGKDKKVYTVGSDSKIIGRLFEVLTQPKLEKVAKKLHLNLNESPKQTIYPDFWLSNPNNPDRNRIAIDIKTTYRHGKKSKFGFTLGSYTSFLRNGTKNIAGSYDMYSTHLIIGFIYTRNVNYVTEVIPFSEVESATPAVLDIDYFVAEKYKISGEKPGSGNTANIGTISSENMLDFSGERGPFATIGNNIFEDYWRNYPTPSERANNKDKYKDLEGYIKCKNIDPQKGEEIERLMKKFNN